MQKDTTIEFEVFHPTRGAIATYATEQQARDRIFHHSQMMVLSEGAKLKIRKATVTRAYKVLAK